MVSRRQALVALLGDVHGNLPALERVLEDARGRGAGAIWNAGDFVGYGAFPEQVVGRLREAGALSIVGNYDRKVLSLEEGDDAWLDGKMPEKRIAFQWAFDQLSRESRDYLRSLPAEERLDLHGRRVLITHASPAACDELVTPDTPGERLEELAAMAGAEVVVFGHSHRPLVRTCAGVTFINPGSVGRPGDGDPRAAYALYRPDAPHPSDGVELIRLEYEVERAVAGIREHYLPEVFAEMVKRGLDVEATLERWSDPAAAFLQELGWRGDDPRLPCILRAARRYDYEEGHTHQVFRLALMLFDRLQPCHGYGTGERFWLACAALLHDIGWSKGPRGHHKSALEIILRSPLLPFTRRERLIVGSTARYHRKALPHPGHDHYAALGKKDRKVVAALAGILRVADGLDRTHRDVVTELSCTVTERRILVRCAVRMPADAEARYAVRKGDLLERVFGREVAVEWSLTPAHGPK